MTYLAIGTTTANRWTCFFCGQTIYGDVTWLGEHEPEPHASPFHFICSNQPWPLYPVDASEVVAREKAEAAS